MPHMLPLVLGLLVLLLPPLLPLLLLLPKMGEGCLFKMSTWLHNTPLSRSATFRAKAATCVSLHNTSCC